MPELQDPTQGRPQNEFPASTVPAAFADGVSSHVNAGGMSKFYFYRVDPNIWGRGGVVFNPVAQVIMPTHGFVAAAAFFYVQAMRMIRSNDITQQQWDEALASLEAQPPAGA